MVLPTRPALLGDVKAEACVLGGGMTGCAAALELAASGRRVVLLEAQAVGSGASGSNLGHIAVGLGCHYTRAVADLGPDGAREVWATHRENHALVRERVERLGLLASYEARGGFAVALDRVEAAELAESEDRLRDDGFPGEFLDHYMLESRFDSVGFAAGYWSADDAEIDSAAFVRALAAAAEDAGAVLFESSPVLRLHDEGDGVRVDTPQGTVQAERAIVATNALAPSLVPFLAERVRPLRAQCLAVATPERLRVPSPAYAGRGRVYWRAAADELRIGGFDDLALPEESTTTLGTTALIQEALERFAREHLAVSGAVGRRWSGLLDISLDGFPFVGPLPGSALVSAVGFTGLGFGYAMLAARWAAENVRTSQDPTPARYRASRPFRPGPWPPWA